MNIEERMQELEKQVDEITETAARLRETFERERQVVSGVPEVEQAYWYLDECGAVDRAQWDNHRLDKKILAFGNIYLTESEAIKAQQQRLAEVRVITRLRELDGGFVADWGDRNQNKCCVYFDHQDGTLNTVSRAVLHHTPPHWVSTLDTWNQVIQEMPEDTKLMMGVEV